MWESREARDDSAVLNDSSSSEMRDVAVEWDVLSPSNSCASSESSVVGGIGDGRDAAEARSRSFSYSSASIRDCSWSSVVVDRIDAEDPERRGEDGVMATFERRGEDGAAPQVGLLLPNELSDAIFSWSARPLLSRSTDDSDAPPWESSSAVLGALELGEAGGGMATALGMRGRGVLLPALEIRGFGVMKGDPVDREGDDMVRVIDVGEDT